MPAARSPCRRRPDHEQIDGKRPDQQLPQAALHGRPHLVRRASRIRRQADPPRTAEPCRYRVRADRLPHPSAHRRCAAAVTNGPTAQSSMPEKPVKAPRTSEAARTELTCQLTLEGVRAALRWGRSYGPLEGGDLPARGLVGRVGKGSRAIRSTNAALSVLGRGAGSISAVERLRSRDTERWASALQAKGPQYSSRCGAANASGRCHSYPAGVRTLPGSPPG